jgi:hypothetical protein
MVDNTGNLFGGGLDKGSKTAITKNASNFWNGVGGFFGGIANAQGQAANPYGQYGAPAAKAPLGAPTPAAQTSFNNMTKLFANAMSAPAKSAPTVTGAKSPTSGVTPASIAATIKPINTNSQRYAEEQAAKQLGQTYTPGQAAGSAATAAQAAQDAARNSKIDTNLGAVYSPLQDLLKVQQAAAAKRYEQNKADITSIFGALSGLTAEDTARINKQFTDSITKQQQDYATRVAEQKTEAAAGTAQAATTGAERGTGPALNVSPVQQAADAANASANETLTNWQGLMQSTQAQTIKDAETRGAGYTQQKLGSLAQLSKNFEDTLSQFATQDATLKSQMAQSKIDAQNAYMSNDFAAAQAADAQQNKLQLQDLKNQGLMDVATLKAKVALARGAGSAKPNLKGVEALMAKAASTGVDFIGVQSSVQDAYNTAYSQKNPDKTKAGKAPTVQEVKAAWYYINGGSPQGMAKKTPVATGLIEDLYK